MMWITKKAPGNNNNEHQAGRKISASCLMEKPKTLMNVRHGAGNIRWPITAMPIPRQPIDAL